MSLLTHRFLRLLPREMGLLAGGNLASQLCSLAAMPLLTRWCNVTDFGFYQLYATTVTVSGMLVCARYEQAILVPKETETARGLCILSSIISVGATGIIVGLIWVIKPALGNGDWRKLADWAPLLGLSLAAGGVTSAVTQYYIRLGRFSSIVRCRIAQSLGTVTIQVGGSALGLGGLALLSGDAIGRVCGVVALVGYPILKGEVIRPMIRWQSLRGLAVQFSRFPLISAPSAIVNAAAISVPVVLLERFYGTHVVGLFSLLERVMGMPSTLIGQPLSQVFSHRLCDSLGKADGRAALAAMKNTARLASFLGGLPFTALLIGGPQLFEFVFGPRWGNAGQLAQLLAIPYFISYVFWPTMPGR